MITFTARWSITKIVFAARLEDFLSARGAMAEADRMGMDGAPLSDYLNMLRRQVLAYLRRQVLAYRRDIVVISLICDHFHQSCDFLKTHDAPCS